MREQDDQGTPPEVVPTWMAKTPATRIEQVKRHARAKTRLGEFQVINQRQTPARRRPSEKIVVSVTDPESALGLDKEKVFRPLYNVQLVKDLDSPLILGYGVFAQNSDGGTLGPMLRHERDGLGLPIGCDLSGAREIG